MTHRITIGDLHQAIESKRLAGVEVTKFALHPDDYFYLEAEALRQRDKHPFHVATDMGVTLFVTKDAARFGS